MQIDKLIEALSIIRAAGINHYGFGTEQNEGIIYVDLDGTKNNSLLIAQLRQLGWEHSRIPLGDRVSLSW